MSLSGFIHVSLLKHTLIYKETSLIITGHVDPGLIMFLLDSEYFYDK